MTWLQVYLVGLPLVGLWALRKNTSVGVAFIYAICWPIFWPADILITSIRRYRRSK